MLAIIPVRDGVLPIGAAEAACEAGEALVVGSGALAAAQELIAYVGDVSFAETPAAPQRLAHALARADPPAQIVIPGSPDGRDLAPLLAIRLHRPLLAGAIEVRPDRVRLSRHASTTIEQLATSGPFVATLIPGVRGAITRSIDVDTPVSEPVPFDLDCGNDSDPDLDLSNGIRKDANAEESAEGGGTGRRFGVRRRPLDAESVEILPPNAATMDLTEASRIVGGGAGLDSEQRLRQLGDVAARLDASMGATRVITDHGWVGHERQIGTTGVVVDPELYIAFGISGAVQHTSGLGHPDHIISVNTDQHCPMMQLADLAIVADANETLHQLDRLLTARNSAAVQP